MRRRNYLFPNYDDYYSAYSGRTHCQHDDDDIYPIIVDKPPSKNTKEQT